MAPVNAITFAFFVAFILLLLPLSDNGKVAFFSIMGFCILGFQVSYAIPIMLKVYYVGFCNRPFPKTSMDLGILSIPLGILSSAWLLGTSCIFFLPTSFPVTAQNMNWLILVVSVVFLLLSLNWIFIASKSFQGPGRDPRANTAEENAEIDADTDAHLASSSLLQSQNPVYALCNSNDPENSLSSGLVT
jgi:amino acid transporter